VKGLEGREELKGERTGTFSDSRAPKSDTDIVFPKSFSTMTRWKQLEKLGGVRIDGKEGSKAGPVSFPGTPFRVEMVVGQVDKARGLIELERLTLAKKTLDRKGNIVYAPVINVAEIVHEKKLRVFGAAKAEESRKAIFMAMLGTIN
jgi:hypothetical protein